MSFLIQHGRIHFEGNNGNLLEYFIRKEANQSIPSFSKLWEEAQAVFLRYGHPHAFEHAMNGQFPSSEVEIAHGDEWKLIKEPSSVPLDIANSKKQKKPPKEGTEGEDEGNIPFRGDQSLAQSCRFLYDATVSREIIFATADGDIGRVWEVLKVSISEKHPLETNAHTPIVDDPYIHRINSHKIC
jgi:hypothetical protein